MAAPHILIVEDDAALARMIADFLEEHGFVAAIEGRGDRVAARLQAEPPSLMILDLMLPGKDGLAVCREVRDAFGGPILMLTARGEEIDEVVGLEVGADDYLTKPVRPRVLLARLRALLRRSKSPPKTERLSVGDLRVDPATRGAWYSEQPLLLTSSEFDLLLFLAANAGEVMSRRVIYQEVRGAAYDEFDRSIDLMVSRLRQKLRDAAGNVLIKSVRGVGYLYVGS
jgi:DNA-binding response OmpR family regulator